MKRTERTGKENGSRISIHRITVISLLSAISFILAFFEFTLPVVPSFIKMDFSDFPALIGTFALGPAAGILIELIKNVLQLLSTSTGGIGELANFLIGVCYVFPAGLIYSLHKTKANARLSFIAGSICMGIMGVVMNYYVLFPMYEMFMPLEQVIAAFEAIIPFIHTKWDVMLYSLLPFNIVKGLVIGGITMLVYKRLSPLLKGNG